MAKTEITINGGDVLKLMGLFGRINEMSEPQRKRMGIVDSDPQEHRGEMTLAQLNRIRKELGAAFEASMEL